MQGALLYPKYHVFPVDEVCEHVLRHLEVRDWQVPGIEVEMTAHDSIGRPMVARVSGEDFSIEFGHGYVGPNLTRLVVPTKELIFWWNAYELTLNVYRGSDWRRDREFFINERHKYHGRCKCSPRYIHYRSRCNCNGNSTALKRFGPIEDVATEALSSHDALHPHRQMWRCPLMVHYDWDRTGYTPVGNEPYVYRTESVMAEMEQWLRTQLLPSIQ